MGHEEDDDEEHRLWASVPEAELFPWDRELVELPMRWAALRDVELAWLTVAVIEPFDRDLADPAQSAHRWWSSVGDRVIMAAVQGYALDYEVTTRSWGVILEVAFATDAAADAFRSGEALRAAIDQLGPLRLEVTSGRGGGTAGARVPRRDRPLLGSGAAELPLPTPDAHTAAHGSPSPLPTH